jgi:hypothetical protein
MRCEWDKMQWTLPLYKQTLKSRANVRCWVTTLPHISETSELYTAGMDEHVIIIKASKLYCDGILR